MGAADVAVSVETLFDGVVEDVAGGNFFGCVWEEWWLVGVEDCVRGARTGEEGRRTGGTYIW